MTAGKPDTQPGLRDALRCAWPAMLLAALLLLPFLNTPFTIDDPLYLREAEHALTDPLHPQAFDVVWSEDVSLRASTILPGGIAVPYLLIPTALVGFTEWAGHLTQLIFLLVTLVATALIALRLGLSHSQARLAAILTASCPAVLGMAGTIMPDIPAMLFVALGMERIVAWRDQREPRQAFVAACWLSLAILTRGHTVACLAAAFVFLLDGITPAEVSSSFRRFPARFIPLFLTPLLFLFASWLTADPQPGQENIALAMLRLPGGWHLVVRNALGFLAHWTLVVPLAIPWLVLRVRRIPLSVFLVALLAAALLFVHLRWIAFPVVISSLALVDILWVAIQRRDRNRLALWVWLFPAITIVIYVHLPSKYLLPSMPAVAVLLAGLIPEARRGMVRWLFPAVAAGGVVLGVLILLGVRDLATIQRRAVTDLIEPYTRAGEHVWFAGHWGFQWYAEHAGASPVTLTAPVPQPGDIIVVSQIAPSLFERKWTAREVLQRETYPSAGPGRIMDFRPGAGFFSTVWGYLPWHWGTGEASRFEVWKVQ